MNSIDIAKMYEDVNNRLTRIEEALRQDAIADRINTTQIQADTIECVVDEYNTIIGG